MNDSQYMNDSLICENAELHKKLDKFERTINSQSDSINQIANIVRSIELSGSTAVSVREVLPGTEKFLKLVQGTYWTYLPACSINYVICRAAPDGKPDDSCTVDGLGPHNRYVFK